MRGQRRYDYMICHHKAEAGAQARLLKMHLCIKDRLRVFLDSDNLTDLDTLLDTVKSKVRQVIVYLTRETLRRPWCAGEIVSAFQAPSVKVLAVRTPTFWAPSARQLE